MTIEISKDAIEAIADAVVKKMQKPEIGHWIEQIDHEENCRTLICSNCDRPALHDEDSIWKHKFCPHCGAKMVEPQEIHCNCTDEEIAKSFIEDVETVKDLLPFPESEHDERVKPSKDVISNVHATWEKVSTDKYIQSANYRYRCSMCGELTIGEPNFCPTCGADMRLE